MEQISQAQESSKREPKEKLTAAVKKSLVLF